MLAALGLAILVSLPSVDGALGMWFHHIESVEFPGKCLDASSDFKALRLSRCGDRLEAQPWHFQYWPAYADRFAAHLMVPAFGQASTAVDLLGFSGKTQPESHIDMYPISLKINQFWQFTWHNLGYTIRPAPNMTTYMTLRSGEWEPSL
ncbi:hypothetical protein Ae201684_003247 [Aphanomyces euteiches]|uniref:Uncharacterized protein n=1 Tax=Aphanomyces euteiches TaxID=100861 RepID=A0A6G0XMV1_9STRA|nr:hypothetical protein Ae201684_003247 [Aphanomyces euteiches]